MQSVIEASEKDPEYQPNYESIEDSAKDLINYASFVVSYMRGKMEGQDPDRDFLNRVTTIPNKMPEAPLVKSD